MGAITGGLILGGAALASGVMGRNAQKQAATRAAAATQAGYNEAVTQMEPYQRAGLEAFTKYQDLVYDPVKGAQIYQESPGFQFALSRGLEAVQNAAAARGNLASGQTLEALQATGQGMAMQDYNDFMNRVLGISNQGFNASTNLANLATGNAASMANLEAARGGASAGFYNNLSQGLQQGAGYLVGSGLQQNQMRAQQSTQPGTFFSQPVQTPVYGPQPNYGIDWNQQRGLS